MITVMLIVFGATVLLVLTVWGGYLKHVETHRLDQMAGDEGDD